MKIIRSLIVFAFVICSSIVASYADINIASPTSLLPGNPSTELTPVSSEDSGNFIGNIIAWFLGLTAVFAVLAITWSGIQMVLSMGEEEKFKKARYTMIYAFVGLIVAGLAYGVVQFVTNLKLNSFL